MNCVIGRRVINHVGIHGNAQSGLTDLLLLLLLLLSSSFLSSSTGSEAALNNLSREICRLLNDADDDVPSI